MHYIDPSKEYQIQGISDFGYKGRFFAKHYFTGVCAFPHLTSAKINVIIESFSFNALRSFDYLKGIF